MIKERIYYVEGMHCASCEILIERKLLELKGVKSVEASLARGEVLVEYEGNEPSLEKLNEIFQKENYIFFDKPQEQKKSFAENSLFKIAVISLFIIAAFLYLNKLGLSNSINVNSKSSLPIFFALGLIAGVSSCAALIGGMILSLSKQWLDVYSDRKSVLEKLQPHLMFNAGRVISFAVLGALLGLLGSRLQISFKFTSFLVIAVSVMMFFLALQMLGIRAFRRFQFTLPKFATRYIANESNFKGRSLPFLMGALTFFLPCGFTITVQGLALISGSPWQGGMITTFFALGTTLPLLLIGLSAIKFSERPHLALQFSKVAGILILFFALFNINNQLNVLGVSSLSDINIKSASPEIIGNNSVPNEEGFAPINNGKQILKMEASSSGYKPNYFKVKAGIPARWEIVDKGTSGCTNAVISRSLFEGEIRLTPGQTSVKEFTPTKPGKYKFSCWMGMISGAIEVINK